MSPANFQPMVDLAFQIVDGVIITVVVPAIGYFVMRKLHIDAQSALGQKIVTIASNAAALGLSRVNARADQALPTEVKSAAIAAGVDYFNAAVSNKTLVAAKITVPIDHMIEAQMQKLALFSTPTPPALPAPAAPETHQ